MDTTDRSRRTVQETTSVVVTLPPQQTYCDGCIAMTQLFGKYTVAFPPYQMYELYRRERFGEIYYLHLQGKSTCDFVGYRNL
jgi:hypothetical protein